VEVKVLQEEGLGLEVVQPLVGQQEKVLRLEVVGATARGGAATGGTARKGPKTRGGGAAARGGTTARGGTAARGGGAAARGGGATARGGGTAAVQGRGGGNVSSSNQVKGKRLVTCIEKGIEIMESKMKRKERDWKP
jgi:hypothetical protein